jgi:hypothetical protein
VDATSIEHADPILTAVWGAIRDRRVVEFSYQHQHRIVHPAELGLDRISGALTLRAYQVGGRSNSRKPPFWLMFRTALIDEFQVTDEAFADDPPYYVPGDAYVDPVYAAL